MIARLRELALLLAFAGASCSKVPIVGVEGGFTLADVSWFEEEQTMFLFWEVEADQGIEDPSRIEIRFVTDTGTVDWAPLDAFAPVHDHEYVDCGVRARCGSYSIHVPLEPRDVDLRLRYHPDGELAMEANTVFNVIARGPAHTNRSATVYGVFTEDNRRLQWRLRHRFPTIRNMQATQLGLRRRFQVEDVRYGAGQSIVTEDNPYGYAAGCPGTFTASAVGPVDTILRAAFAPDDLPQAAVNAPMVCARSRVFDPTGPFEATALARKNPETRAGFPVIRSPVKPATPLKFFLTPCNRTIEAQHADMQRQRLQMEGLTPTCTDDVNQDGFVENLVSRFRAAVDQARPAGDDMILVIGLHQDQDEVADALEEALAQVVPPERHRASPRLAGAFVFESTNQGSQLPELSNNTLWCPTQLDDFDASTLTCPFMPDLPDINLGPFTFGTLPILPSRSEYLTFLEDFSDAQTGRVEDLEYLVPEFATDSEHVDLGPFGVATFQLGERIGAADNDAFSHCTPDEAEPFVFRSPLMSNPQLQQIVQQQCAIGALPFELCAVAVNGLLPIQWLPDWHNLTGENDYQVGLSWPFPFLLRMEFRGVFAGAVGVLGASIPFGFGQDGERYLGTDQWLAEDFPIDSLLQCTRYCDHPTFDIAGVYHVRDLFRQTYANACYEPLFPAIGDPGFPLDP